MNGERPCPSPDFGHSGESLTGFAPVRGEFLCVIRCLTLNATVAPQHQIAALAPGSTLAMTLVLPLELAEPEERPARHAAEEGARAAGTHLSDHERHEGLSSRCFSSLISTVSNLAIADFSPPRLLAYH